jgi:hypothetical protein
MKQALTSALTFCLGAFAGAVGLSVILGLLFWMLNPAQMSIAYDAGYSMLMLLFTVPMGGIFGGVIATAWFCEGRG